MRLMQLPATSAGRSFQWLADMIHTVQGNWSPEKITLVKLLEEQWHRKMKRSTQFILILTLRVTKSRGKLRWQQHMSRARWWRDRGRKAAEAHTAGAGRRSRGAALTSKDGDTIIFPYSTYLMLTSARQVVQHGSAPFWQLVISHAITSSKWVVYLVSTPYFSLSILHEVFHVNMTGCDN